jgi:hypothetical protein
MITLGRMDTTTTKHDMHYYSVNLVSCHVVDFKMGHLPLTQSTFKMNIC